MRGIVRGQVRGLFFWKIQIHHRLPLDKMLQCAALRTWTRQNGLLFDERRQVHAPVFGNMHVQEYNGKLLDASIQVPKLRCWKVHVWMWGGECGIMRFLRLRHV